MNGTMSRNEWHERCVGGGYSVLVGSMQVFLGYGSKIIDVCVI